MYEVQNCNRAGADIRGVGALAIFRNRQHVSFWTFGGDGGNALLTSRIDDINGITLAAAASLKKGATKGSTVGAATEVGKRLAEAAKAAGLTKAAFDRGHYKYHGRLKALADAVRAGGIQF